MKISIFWFRRDLRLEDNTALYHAITKNKNILPIFIFDENILNELAVNDPRVTFIYQTLLKINTKLKSHNTSVKILKGEPFLVWKSLLQKYNVDAVYVNKDYEPYAIKRDQKIKELLSENNIKWFAYKDQVIFEESEIIKADGNPYIKFTPYKNKWLSAYTQNPIKPKIEFSSFLKTIYNLPTLKTLGFLESKIKVPEYSLSILDNYATTRDYPALDATSHLGTHLRFGTISIRQIISQLKKTNEAFLTELIWREFFMQIIYHFPKVVTHNFNSKYNTIKWRNNEEDFKKWCAGKTGYPLVDAGMRQLNRTGYMHNRVRMVAASFLCKHLLINWRWGEAYFAKKLLDFDLASNNGNWQWVAGTGCDAAPYFRIFNPTEQLKKFDKTNSYIKTWIPELRTSQYPLPMVNHKEARVRALEVYKAGIIN